MFLIGTFRPGEVIFKFGLQEGVKEASVSISVSEKRLNEIVEELFRKVSFLKFVEVLIPDLGFSILYPRR